jgi:hypothetical protein
LTEAELKSIETVQAPILTAVTLTNDYFSWDKEYQLHIQSGQSTPLLNAVYFIKCWERIPDANAKVKLRNIICGLEKGYSSLKSGYLPKNPTASQNILKWVGCLEAFAAGNMIKSTKDDSITFILDKDTIFPGLIMAQSRPKKNIYKRSIEVSSLFFIVQFQAYWLPGTETGGLFRIATRTMKLHSTENR